MLLDSNEHLKWLEKERAKRTFNIGDYNIKATPDEIRIKGKTPDSWGQEVVLDRSKTKAEILTESRTPMFIFYLVYAAYAFGFLMFFLTTGISVATQIAVLGVALFLMFTPLLLELLLPTHLFLISTGVFFVVVFSLSGISLLSTTFKAVESSVGKGYVELFIIFASIFPLLLRRMVGQMLINYRLRLEEGSKKFEILSSSPSAPALVNYMKHGHIPRRFLKLPLYFFTLSRKRMKSCVYCGKATLDECKRCHRPICDTHIELLRGYKVCLDCFIDRRGKIRRNLR